MEPPRPPHGAPGPPFRGLPIENPFRRPCLFNVTDLKTISRGASDFFDCGKNLGTHGAPPWSPHGAPPGGYLWKIPSGAPSYLLWHVGYQLYSDFSKKNESRVDATLFWMGLPRGWPRGATPVTLRGPRQRSPLKLMELRHVGYQLYSDFSKKNESRVDTTLFWMFRGHLTA